MMGIANQKAESHLGRAVSGKGEDGQGENGSKRVAEGGK